MIKFFRHIRKSLLMENKTSKYFKYAIGEIILVVIGILIALWFNQRANFNAERQKEIKGLKEIRINLDSDLVEISEDISYMDSVRKGCAYVLSYIPIHEKPNTEFNHSALIMRTTPHFNPNKGGYNLLVSKGIEIIQNDELRSAISYHFESMYTYYNRYEKERIDFRIIYMEKELIKYFSYKEIPGSPYLGIYQINQQDYLKLKSEGSFLKLVMATKRANVLVQDRAYRLKNSIIQLSESIDKELETRQ